jgi:hypothetical protein
MVLDQFGDIIKTACGGALGGTTIPSVDPDGVHGNCIEVSNLQTNLSGTTNPLRVFTQDNMRIWCAAGVTQTFTWKAQTSFAAGVSAGMIALSAEYISSGVSGTISTTVSEATAIQPRLNNADWSQTIAVTVTPQVAGFVRFRLDLRSRESGKALYIWPKPVIS